jgi:hypothetical protein
MYIDWWQKHTNVRSNQERRLITPEPAPPNEQDPPSKTSTGKKRKAVAEPEEEGEQVSRVHIIDLV